jgi:hypothetical protein
MEKMISIDKLVDVYNSWGNKNNLQPLESADAMFWDQRVNDEHKLWLERFIRVWDKTQDKEAIKQSLERLADDN